MNKNGSKNGEHLTVINHDNLVELQRPMCIHGPTLLFEKTFDNGNEPIRFHACSAFRNPKQCSILSNEQVILNRAHLQAHSKSFIGLAEVNNVFCLLIFTINVQSKNIAIFTLDRQILSKETSLLSYVLLFISNKRNESSSKSRLYRRNQ